MISSVMVPLPDQDTNKHWAGGTHAQTTKRARAGHLPTMAGLLPEQNWEKTV